MQWLGRKVKRSPASKSTERTQQHGRTFGLVSTINAMISRYPAVANVPTQQTVVNISFFGLHLLLTFNQSAGEQHLTASLTITRLSETIRGGPSDQVRSSRCQRS